MATRRASLLRPPTPDREQDEQASKRVSLEEKIRYQLYASGERERLKRLLTDKLTDCGWKENVKDLCREVIERRGRDNITAEEIVAAVRPVGRQTVPDPVKAQLLAEIKQLIMKL